MAFCICNFKTYNTLTSISNIQKEATREHEYDNIDKTRTHLNEVVCGSMDYVAEVKKAMKGAYYTTPDARGRYHAEAKVKALGVVLTYSPEAEGTFDREKWIKENIDFLKERFPGCPIHITSHQDERTFHLQGIIIPTTKEGKISKNSFIRGKKDLVKIQDEYAERMKQFGLERGIHRDRDTKMKNIPKDEYDELKTQNAAMKKTLLKAQKIINEQKDLIKKQEAKIEHLNSEIVKYINHNVFGDEKPSHTSLKDLIEESTTEHQKRNTGHFKGFTSEDR